MGATGFSEFEKSLSSLNITNGKLYDTSIGTIDLTKLTSGELTIHSKTKNNGTKYTIVKNGGKYYFSETVSKNTIQTDKFGIIKPTFNTYKDFYIDNAKIPIYKYEYSQTSGGGMTIKTYEMYCIINASATDGTTKQYKGYMDFNTYASNFSAIKMSKSMVKTDPVKTDDGAINIHDTSSIKNLLSTAASMYDGTVSSNPIGYINLEYILSINKLYDKDYIPNMKNASIAATLSINTQSIKVISGLNSTSYDAKVTKLDTRYTIPFYAWYYKDNFQFFNLAVYVKLSDGSNNSNAIMSVKRTEGWILLSNPNQNAIIIKDANGENKKLGDIDDPEDNNDDETEQSALDPLTEVNDINQWVSENMSAQYAEELQYFEELYGGYETVWSTRSFRSIIGMPFHFLQNTDPRVGSSPLGKQFIEDIVYDMPLVCLRPGGPVMNSSISGSSKNGGVLGLVKKFLSYKSYFINDHAESLATFLDAGDDTEVDSGDDTGLVDGVKTALTNLFVGKYARYYTFGSDMTKYIEYVNTLCHLFISFLGIGDMYYTPGTQYESNNTQPEPRKYAYYNDTWETVEADGGDSMKFMQGPNQAIFGYYQPDSQLNQTYSNSTRDSEMASAIDQGSSIAKEFHFLMGTASEKLMDLGSGLFENLGQINGNALVGRLFGNAAEGISTVLAGNNIDLPQIWDDSTGGAEHTLVFKLVSPYGDRESIFLYVLRPLARLLAMSLPRQFGPNSYTSPFLVQAFSKGQFNVQCGIVSSISIKRCGNGGESHTVHYIPTELEVTMTIQDMYGLVTLSNEYLGSASNTDGIIAHIASAINKISPFGAAKAARLLFNNIGLIDFCAAYCGYNLNAPEIDTMWTLLMDIWANRISDMIENPLTTGTSQWKSPKWAREMTDAFYGAVQKYLGFISG